MWYWRILGFISILSLEKKRAQRSGEQYAGKWSIPACASADSSRTKPYNIKKKKLTWKSLLEPSLRIFGENAPQFSHRMQDPIDFINSSVSRRLGENKRGIEKEVRAKKKQAKNTRAMQSKNKGSRWAGRVQRKSHQHTRRHNTFGRVARICVYMKFLGIRLWKVARTISTFVWKESNVTFKEPGVPRHKADPRWSVVLCEPKFKIGSRTNNNHEHSFNWLFCSATWKAWPPSLPLSKQVTTGLRPKLELSPITRKKASTASNFTMFYLRDRLCPPHHSNREVSANSSSRQLRTCSRYLTMVENITQVYISWWR